MKKTIAVSVVLCALVLGLVAPQTVLAHCQIPCGIYGDQLRIEQLKEHITTIAKSMRLIEELSAADAAANTNQIVRWVMNKEEHAGEFVEIIEYYFMQQRIKPLEEGEEGYREYVKQVVLCHHMQVAAMKCKQSTDQQYTQQLSELVDAFAKSYFDPEDYEHLEHHHGQE
ncbi:MAG: superoxide dismutase [Ni] [Candidatus Hydrogenedentota bacterium]